jgi:hypothetical protein
MYANGAGAAPTLAAAVRLKPTPITAVLRRVVLRPNLAVTHSVSMPQRLEAP